MSFFIQERRYPEISNCNHYLQIDTEYSTVLTSVSRHISVWNEAFYRNSIRRINFIFHCSIYVVKDGFNWKKKRVKENYMLIGNNT